jgi:hypothetical protein
VGGAAVVVLAAGGLSAQVTTERSASILVFPRVIADGTRDTIIQITNTSNSMVHAHCFYVNGELTFPDLPPGPLNPPLWTETDFDIWLTKQQPTHWVVSEGRLVDPTDQPCSNSGTQMEWQCSGVTECVEQGFFACNGAGTDPGRVPPVGLSPRNEGGESEHFTGELKCIEVDATGAPVSGNHLKGEATEVTLNVCDIPPGDTTGFCFNTSFSRHEEIGCTTNEDCPDVFDVSKSNALGILGNENNNGDNVLCLGGEPSDVCPNGAEYDACPAFWIANHYAFDAPDPAAGPDSAVFTSWTIVPCTENFETQTPETITVFIDTWNEFEQAFSSFATVTCWADLFLEDINPVTFAYETLGTTFAQSRLRSTADTASGFLMMQHEEHETADFFYSYADVNLHVEGARPGPDLITIPPEQTAQ